MNRYDRPLILEAYNLLFSRAVLEKVQTTWDKIWPKVTLAQHQTDYTRLLTDPAPLLVLRV